MAQVTRQIKGVCVDIVGRIVIRRRDMSRPIAASKVRHVFNFDVDIPEELLDALQPMFKRVCDSVECEERTPEEWVERIKKYIRSEDVRTWVASIAWWDYMSGNADNVLFEMCQPLPPDFEASDKELENALKAVGFPDPKERASQIMGATAEKVNEAIKKLGPQRLEIKNEQEN